MANSHISSVGADSSLGLLSLETGAHGAEFKSFIGFHGMWTQVKEQQHAQRTQGTPPSGIANDWVP